jgi:hypothetical protein
MGGTITIGITTTGIAIVAGGSTIAGAADPIA